MSAIDARNFIADEEVKPFIYDQRVDLTAADVPVTSTGQFIIASLTAKKGQVQIIKAIAPYAMKRTAAGVAANESFQVLTPEEANGYFVYTPTVNNISPFVITSNVNSPRLIAAPQNSDRQSNSGIMYVSRDPWQDVAHAWYNPMFSILVPSENTFRVIFSLVPAAIASPMTNVFVVGNPTPPATKRVDFAGVVFGGMTMTEQKYRKLSAELEHKGKKP